MAVDLVARPVAVFPASTTTLLDHADEVIE
jgi:hypothetical protein